MYTKKIAYFLIVLSGLTFVGCGGGSSSGDSNPPLDNTPPVANAGADQIVIVGDTVTLDASGSTDNDGIIIAYEWKENDTVLSTATDFNKSDFSIGEHTITLTVTDDDNDTGTDAVIITVTDNITLDDFDDVTLHEPLFETTHFSGSQNCVQCHDGLEDANGTDVSIVKAWQGTMMANAATDPFWKAKVATEVKEHPEFKQTIEAKCSRCHTPMANVEATYNGDTVALSGDGFLNHNNLYYDAAMQGVSCTLCHQIENTPELGTTEGFSGGFVIDTNNTGIERKIYGPYEENLRTQPMINNVQFTPVYSQHTEDSKLCASCHNLETPVIATDGTLTNFTFPEQAAYTEWEYSDFNGTEYSCQNCHMPKAEGSVIISKQGGNLQARPNFHQHKFLGANTYMLEILKNNRVKLGVLADEARFNESITDTREFLKAAADVNITQWNVQNDLQNFDLNFDVKITNHSGHKFPTGFPSRRAWLHVTVKNSADQIVFESGAINSSGQISGVVYDSASNTYEPHYDKITDPSQVQIYETILQDTDDNMTYILLHALHYFKDNRILPKGLDKNDVNLPETINPHGNAENDNDFIGGSDTVTYEIANLPADDYTITTTLHYQTLSYGFAQDLYKNAELREVALMKLLDTNAVNRYETISTDNISITVP